VVAVRRYFGHGGGEGQDVVTGFGNVCQQRETPTSSLVPRKSTGSPVQPRTMPSCALFSMRVWAMNAAAGWFPKKMTAAWLEKPRSSGETKQS
jgi:hypothetical protein